MDNVNELKRSKISCPQTGIEIKRTLCAICSPSNHCGIDAYVKDGKLIKCEGTSSHPVNHGLLCTKGCANREFVYRDDRVMTPLRRIGKKGEGKFEPISWDEAYDEISARLIKSKSEYGAQSVAFFGGYSKWFRPWLRRFAHSFGSMNYGTESSTCMTTRWMAWQLISGRLSAADMKGTKLYLGWAYNPYYSKYLNASGAEELKAAGTKFIIVDSRYTPAAHRLADLFLQPRPGTDGALALCMANTLIQNDWVDKRYISDCVYGYERFKDLAAKYNQTNVEELTGVPYELVEKACRMIHENAPIAISENSAAIPHHRNGFQNYRAIMALSVLTGSYDKAGGQRPVKHTFTHMVAGFETREEEFGDATTPSDAKLPVGAERFPLWNHLEHEMQCTDLARQILEEKPYPIKAVFAMGMNYRMLPGDTAVKQALEKVDFFVDTDLFLTDTAKLADIVLPVCSSFERGEFMAYPRGFAWYTNPVIDRVGNCRSDVEILQQLALRMDLPDEELKAGYEENMRYILSDLDVTVERLKSSDTPVKVPGAGQPPFGAYTARGFDTPTGKLELVSKLLENHPEWGLDPLPTYTEPFDEADARKYPYCLCSGGRIPNTLHSRLHDVPWLRSIRPEPMADLSRETAAELGIEEGDTVEIFNDHGCVTVKARPSSRIARGQVYLVHGYREADVNALVPQDHLDPFTGFPGYNCVRCGLRKGE